MKTKREQQKIQRKRKRIRCQRIPRFHISPIIILSILIIILAMPQIKAFPSMNLIGQADPLEYGSIQKILLNITSMPENNTIIQTLIGFEQQNHTLQKEGPYYVYSWQPQQKGTNNYQIYATDSLNETQILTGSFSVVDTTPPEIIQTGPQGLINYNLVELKATTNENSTCKYDEADVSYDSMYFALSGEGAIHTKLRSFGDGSHLFFVRCRDTSGNIGPARNISFTADTQPPLISDINPTGTVTQPEVTLKLYTNEPAICKWAKTNQEYDGLGSHFQTTSSTYHEQPLTLNEGINTYYLSCKDQIGNKNPVITLRIELNLPPKAAIDIETDGAYRALKEGTYSLSLVASEPLAQAPSLKLRYSNKLLNIPLEGSAESWKGYLIIPNDAVEEIGEFIYAGTDLKGTVGTEITSGKLLLIDTMHPSTPIALRVLNENNRIKISWEYDGEEPNYFNIYRSTTGKTDTSNLKATTKEESYADSDVTNKIGYFYRVGAVDKAGNEGQLSEEQFIMTEFDNATNQFRQDTDILDIVNRKISELERITQDLDVRKARLESTSNQDLLAIINDNQLIQNQNEIKSKIQTLIGELKTYRTIAITPQELNAKIEIINTKLVEYKKDMISDVNLINKVQNEQIPRENLIYETVSEFIKNRVLTEEQRKGYFDKIKRLQEETRLTQEIISYEIDYDGGARQKTTIIRETLMPSAELKGLIVQEVIPDNVLKLSEISFSKTPNEINSMGVIWSLNDLENNEIKYAVSEAKDVSELQGIRTVILYDVDEFLVEFSEQKINMSNAVTGVVVSDNKGFGLSSKVLVPLGALLIVLLLIYYFIFLKTENVYEQEAAAGLVLNLGERALDKVKRHEEHNSKKERLSAIDTLGDEPFQASDLDSIFTFIQQAYEALENKDLDSARKNYSSALSSYAKQAMDFKDKMKVNFEMNLLRENILLLAKTKHLYT